MEFYQIVILALLQGLTEFLPISSSAHLILPSQLLGWDDQGLAFDVAVHVGSLFAVVWYFRHDLRDLISAWLASVCRRKHSEEAQLGWYLLVATVPAGLAGLAVNDFVEVHLRSTFVIASATVVFGILLWFADRKAQHHQAAPLSWKTALVVGFAQALALIPGTSRSGITMTAGLLMGLQRELSARFSFLLSIPLIMAAGGLKTLELLEQEGNPHWADMGLGVILSAVSAYLCIHLFLQFIERIGFTPFVIYRLILGLVLYTFVIYA